MTGRRLWRESASVLHLLVYTSGVSRYVSRAPDVRRVGQTTSRWRHEALAARIQVH